MIIRTKFYISCTNIRAMISVVLSRRVHYEHDSVTSHNLYKYLANIMGIYVSTAKRKLFLNVELTSKPLLEIVETYKTLEKLNFDKTLIAENISVLALSSKEVKQRHRSLKELGLKEFQVPEVLRFSDIVSQSKKSLVSAGFISSNSFDLRSVDVKKSPDRLEETVSIMEIPSDDSLPLQIVRCRILAETIGRKLKFDREITDRLLESCIPLTLSSLSFVAETLDILTKDFKLNQQIRCSPILLSVPPEDIENIVSICSQFDLNVRLMVVMRPRLLCTTPNLFKLICHHMYEYGVPMENVERFPAIFDYSPDFILRGLRLLSVWPDFKSVRSTLNLFQLLAVSRQADQRLAYLKRDSIVNCSLKYLITKDVLFKELLVNAVREESVGYEEILSYVADRLECSYEDVSENFDLDSNSGSLSITVARNTLTYLMRQDFTKTMILKGIPLLLYQWQIVDEVLKDLPSSELAQPYSEWKQNDNILHLVLYIIRRNKVCEGEWVHPQIEVRDDLESTEFIANQEIRNDCS